MLKRVISKIFGFEKEIQRLREQVQELSWDTSFGMWTRGAFLQFCHVMPRSARIVAFIDLDDIHKLNQQFGYTEVDRRVKAAFSVSFRRSDVVARWYSGDEIVILFDADMSGAERKIDELINFAYNQGLSFKYELGEWIVGKTPIEDVIKEMADKTAMCKVDREV